MKSEYCKDVVHVCMYDMYVALQAATSSFFDQLCNIQLANKGTCVCVF